MKTSHLLLAIIGLVIIAWCMGYLVGQHIEEKRHWPYVLPPSLRP